MKENRIQDFRIFSDLNYNLQTRNNQNSNGLQITQISRDLKKILFCFIGNMYALL